MQRIGLKVRTHLFEPSDLVRVAARVSDAWHHVSLNQAGGIWKGELEIEDDVRSVEIMTRIKGPAFGSVKLVALLPSGHEYQAINAGIESAQANIWFNVYGELQW